jgi:hypothetical protein
MAVLFACAFSVFFAQEAQSLWVDGAVGVIAAIVAITTWPRLRGTNNRFVVGVFTVVSVTFLTFFINGLYPSSGLSYVAAAILVVTLGFFTLYAFIQPSGQND